LEFVEGLTPVEAFGPEFRYLLTSINRVTIGGFSVPVWQRPPSRRRYDISDIIGLLCGLDVMGRRSESERHNEGGASNHTGGTNQDQGGQPQGDRGHKDFKIRHTTRQKLRVMTLEGYLPVTSAFL